MSNENEKAVEMNQEQENNTVEIQEVKKGPKAWFSGLKTWQKVALGGAALGVTIYGGVKLHKVLTKNSKQVGEVIPMDTVTDAVEELAKAE